MALREFKCIRCEQTFVAGKWECSDGLSHEVESKTYYTKDAPLDMRDSKHSGLTILNVTPERQETRGNDIIRIPGRHVRFQRGLFSTSDPQLQAALDARQGVFSGEEGLKIWESAYISDREKQELDNLRLKSENVRLQQERNTLLQQIQEQKGKRVSA